MTVTVEEFKRLKKQVEQKRTAAERAEGAHEAALERLKELGFDSVKAAEDELEDLEIRLEQAEKAYRRADAEFKAKWGDSLDG